VSPGEVSLTFPDGTDQSHGAKTSGHTVFYVGARLVATADTGGRYADSAARRKSAAGTNTVRAHASGDVAVTAASTGKRIPAIHKLVRRARSWTVQVAAYETFDEAQALQGMLCGRGYEARILGAVRPYDVRVGRFPTSDSALAIARRLSSRHLTVFVTPSE
jgi:cell division protein FtsN